MKILYFTTPEPDYLQDSIFIGLRNIYGASVVDFPQKKCLYLEYKSSELYGNGFTLYSILPEVHITRNDIEDRLKNNEFDYIIFSSIHRQIDILKKYSSFLKNKKVVILDGEDHPSLFGYNGKYWRNPKYWFLPKVHKKYPYFKREYTEETLQYRYFKLLPKLFLKNKRLKKVFPTSFGFPDSKIIKELPQKEKLFPEHIVDVEIAKKIDKGDSYAFDNETDYYLDLQKSKFGITTKRAGWDAMRHYEITANGAVPCFRDLDKKPLNCAPHGLNDSNSITYSSYSDLIRKVNSLSDKEYSLLQQNAIKWAKENSTKVKAEELLAQIQHFYR